MKTLFFTLALSALTFFSSMPSAQAALAGCHLSLRVRSTSILIVERGGGTGYLTCTDVQGHTTRSRMHITIRGLGVGLGHFKFYGVSENLGIVDIHDLEGTYSMVDANVAVLIGGGASLGFYNQDNGFSFALQGRAGTGLGAAVGGSLWTIRAY